MVSDLQTPSVTEMSIDFEVFFRAEYTRLSRAMLLLTGDRAEAEDLAQESMSRVYERWERVRRMDSPTGYLYRTALNLNRKRLRRLAVHAKRVAAMRLPDALQIAEDRVEALRAVASLPAPQREALVLVEWLGYDAEEAGKILAIEAASVRGRLHRARKTLHERLGGSDA